MKFQDALDKTLKEHYAFTDEDLDELDELLKTTKSEMAVPRRILSVRTIKAKRRRKRAADSDDDAEEEIEAMDEDQATEIVETKVESVDRGIRAPAATVPSHASETKIAPPFVTAWTGPVIHLRTLDGGMQAIPLFSESYLAAQR